MAKLKDSDDCPSHSFLVYKNKEDEGWNWFENSDYNNRGIHKFATLEELLKYQQGKYIEFLRTLNITEDELDCIIRKEFSKPKVNCRAREYLDWVIDFGIDI